MRHYWSGSTTVPYPAVHRPRLECSARTQSGRGAGTSPPPATAASNGYAISGSALQFRGTPYRNGGRDPSGFDCSGFVWYVFDQNGVHVPRTVAEQFRTGTDVDPVDLRAGDLVFFDTVNGPARQTATHVGISIGGDEFVHAPSTTGEVRVERLASSYWAPRFVGARRMHSKIADCRL